MSADLNGDIVDNPAADLSVSVSLRVRKVGLGALHIVGEGAGADGAESELIAGLPVEDLIVLTTGAGERSVTRIEEVQIVARPAGYPVVASSCIDSVIAGSGIYDVITAAGVDDVGAWRQRSPQLKPLQFFGRPALNLCLLWQPAAPP